VGHHVRGAGNWKDRSVRSNFNNCQQLSSTLPTERHGFGNQVETDGQMGTSLKCCGGIFSCQVLKSVYQPVHLKTFYTLATPRDQREKVVSPSIYPGTPETDDCGAVPFRISLRTVGQWYTSTHIMVEWFVLGYASVHKISRHVCNCTEKHIK
jgi:hypothetical protein